MEKQPFATKTAYDIYIAGWKTIEDWKAFRATLLPSDTPVLWQAAFDEYFHERLSLRYLESISDITGQRNIPGGEGFSIVAIRCSLIEFLESNFLNQPSGESAISTSVGVRRP